MRKIYKYPRWKFLAFLILGPLLFLFIKGFLYEAFPVENYTYSSILVLLVSFLAVYLIQAWRDLSTKIIADSSGIIIKRPFKSYYISWKEITEFGRYRRVAAYVGGFWVYYLRSSAIGNKKITLGTKGLKDLEDLVLYIIFKAYNANLVNVQKAQKVSD
jgi:hypothetical protein